MGETYDVVDIPEAVVTDAEHWRHELIDVASAYDETVLEKYVAEESRLLLGEFLRAIEIVAHIVGFAQVIRCDGQYTQAAHGDLSAAKP